MALIALTSASGSPGVTTTALGLALTWPRPVLLVEADPTGGSAVLAGYFRGVTAHTGGLLDLAWAHREDLLANALTRAVLPIPDSEVSFLPGPRSHSQAHSLAGLWEPLTELLQAEESIGRDVVVDAGRLGLSGSPEPLLSAANLVLLVMRTDLVALSAARSWAETLRDELEHAGTGRVQALLVGEGRPYRRREIEKVLGLPVLASLTWDPNGAAVFSHGATPPRRFAGSGLPRSLRAARAAIQATLDADRRDLAVMGGKDG